jgi:hypothetical protein
MQSKTTTEDRMKTAMVPGGQLQYIDDVDGINHMIKPTSEGYHPVYCHLVMAEIEEHHGSYILTIEGHKGDALISYEDAQYMFGKQFDEEFGYISDEYVNILEE